MSLVRLIVAVGLAAIDTIWALYMESFGLNESTIGFISSGLVLITLFTAFQSTIILEKFREYKVLLLSLVIFIISYLSISLLNNLYVFLLFSVILTITSVLRINSFEILFRDESKEGELNQDEGLMYTLSNVGWSLGPLIASFFMISYGISSVFVAASIFLAIALFLLLFMKIKQPLKKRDILDSNFKVNFLEFLKKPQLIVAYFMAFGIEIWWALIFIYMPLFIVNSGKSAADVGVFIACATLPLILFEFEAGRFSSRFGFKPFFFLGFIILAICSTLAFFMTDIIYILITLVIASFGMALIEPLQDSYFFKQVTSNEEERFYPIFATANDFGSFVGKFVLAGVLLFLVSSYVYITMALMMFILAIVSLKIKD